MRLLTVKKPKMHRVRLVASDGHDLQHGETRWRYIINNTGRLRATSMLQQCRTDEVRGVGDVRDVRDGRQWLNKVYRPAGQIAIDVSPLRKPMTDAVARDPGL